MSLKSKIDATELAKNIQETGEGCLDVIKEYQSSNPEYYQAYEEGYKKAMEMAKNCIIELQKR